MSAINQSKNSNWPMIIGLTIAIVYSIYLFNKPHHKPKDELDYDSNGGSSLSIPVNSQSNLPPKDAPTEIEDQEEKGILEKLKKKAQRDWPEDYSMQEFWINDQIEAYRRMKAIPNDAIKRKAQRDWPLDFSMQEYWYNDQVEAKERLSK